MKIRRALFVDLFDNFYDRHSVYYLSATLKRLSVETNYICSMNHHKILRAVREFEPDVVMYSAFSPQVPRYKDFDKKLKETFPNVFSIIGGPAFNSEDSRLSIKQSTINAACIGEGELALEDFVRTEGSCTKNLVPSERLGDGLCFNKYVDLNSLALPDRSVVYKRDSLLERMPTKQFLAGRGCPYKCTYCHNHLDNELFKSAGSNPVRLKDPDYVIEEISDVRRKYPLKSLVFQDDVFFLNKKWGYEFCEKYARKLAIPFTCNLRANYINEDLIQALKGAGCSGVFWSIESGDEELRNKQLKRNMSNEQILRSAELMNKYGIKHRIGNVIGTPGESFGQMLKTLELNIRAKPYLSAAYIFIPFQDLELTKYAIANGYLDPDQKEPLPLTFSKNSILNFSEKEKDEIRKLMALFPMLTKHPLLYEHKWVFNVLLKIPLKVLMFINGFYYLYFSSKMYKVSADFRTKIRIAMRFIACGT